MKMDQQKTQGFTLLEMLLVLAISSSLIVLMLNYTTQKSDEMRRDKTVLQMQQILNAGLSFYVNNSRWPVTSLAPTDDCGANTSSPLDIVSGSNHLGLVPNYIPQVITNSYGAQSYSLNCISQPTATYPAFQSLFYVYTKVDKPVNASIIAGKLPMAFVTTQTDAQTNPPTQDATCQSGALGTNCTYVVAFVNIPGQNLNNARSVNFAGTYSSGACVPAPNCPQGMQPEIFAVPASVNGVFDDPKCSGGANCLNVYPVSSFTAFALGTSKTNSTPALSGTGPVDCTDANNTPCALSAGEEADASANIRYWRVCLSIATSKGPVVVNSGSSDKNAWGAATGSVIAFTRCAPNLGTEIPSGTPFGVWQP